MKTGWVRCVKGVAMVCEGCGYGVWMCVAMVCECVWLGCVKGVTMVYGGCVNEMARVFEWCGNAWSVNGVCMVCVWCVWCVYGKYMVYMMCMVCAWCVYGVCVWCVYDVCMVCAWCVFLWAADPAAAGLVVHVDRTLPDMRTACTLTQLHIYNFNIWK